MSRLEFQHVLVTNVQTTSAPVSPTRATNETTTGIAQVTGTQYVVTLALSPEQSERFVFATEFGQVWLSHRAGHRRRRRHPAGHPRQRLHGGEVMEHQTPTVIIGHDMSPELFVDVSATLEQHGRRRQGRRLHRHSPGGRRSSSWCRRRAAPARPPSRPTSPSRSPSVTPAGWSPSTSTSSSVTWASRCR